MTLAQVGGILAILLICPLLGGLPLIDWITYALTGKQLAKLGTGNVSVSAAFYHGGRWVGILAVLSEASKGIAAVLLSRAFFPAYSVWELAALIALVMGRFWMGKGAGVTNVVWGIVVHDPIAAFLILLIGGVSFTIFRDRSSGRISILVLLAAILALRHSQETEYIMVAFALSGLLFWIYQKIPDDLNLTVTEGHQDSQKMFRLFRGDRHIVSLSSQVSARKVGQKAANLSRLKQLGYPVPDGWILKAGDDLEPLVEWLEPNQEQPLAVRSSAVGEDSASASAAGQYQSFLNIRTRQALKEAIVNCQASYFNNSAVEYRRDRQQPEQAMAVLIQKQIRGIVSGVAFSRNPVDKLDDSVLVEALTGDAERVVSGRFTPQRYQVYLPNRKKNNSANLSDRQGIAFDRAAVIAVEENKESEELALITRDIPTDIIESIAYLARELEELERGIPQDIEWTYDGEQLWLLQARPIVTLQPMWTRKIAAEVIPGAIRPLTWSINRPLTCGVWGDIFKLVLGKRAQGLDFEETATLHYSHAYFNASLLGKIFLSMGLPPESLEFLTRGEPFSKPPRSATLKNLPGLLRLLVREWHLERDFQRDRTKLFDPVLRQIDTLSQATATPTEILERIELILLALNRATYYSILAPLSVAIRSAIFKIEASALDNSQIPEIASLQSLAALAADTRRLLKKEEITFNSCASLFAHLAENPDGENILEQFDRWLEKYGYLSEAATDIAIPRWRENPRPAREMFAQLFFDREACAQRNRTKQFQNCEKLSDRTWFASLVQRRLNLKGQVTETYERLLANLRWSFLELEKTWLGLGWLTAPGDLFFLEFDSIRSVIRNPNSEEKDSFELLVQTNKAQHQSDRQIKNIPYLIYGKPMRSALPIANNERSRQFKQTSPSTGQTLRGIGASSGQVEGTVKILLNWQDTSAIDRDTILVVPYTDAGWSPLLARAGGIISEVGGRLSHGAIIAREYGIPAVMDIHHATQLLQDGQRVRIDGRSGVVEIL
ncbi:MAG: glycerol-3-phosphate acyltransferase [Xenococcaceae cyanobacterium]